MEKAKHTPGPWWEIMRFHSSMETVMGNALQSPDNFLKALEQAREALKKATE